MYWYVVIFLIDFMINLINEKLLILICGFWYIVLKYEEKNGNIFMFVW